MTRLIISSLAFTFLIPTLVYSLQENLSKELEFLGEKKFLAAMNVIKSYKNRIAESAAVCNGRLTLTSGTAVTTSNVTAATTVYFTPYNGNAISVYDGSVWQLLTFTEKSVVVPSTTTTPFDIFAYNNAGTLALETLDWTNDTTRATALTTQDGIYVKSGAATRRYLGTGRTTSVSGQTEDSLTNRLLWNLHNQVPRRGSANGTGHTYGTNAQRVYNNDTSSTVTFVLGLAQTASGISLNRQQEAKNTQLFSAFDQAGDDSFGQICAAGTYQFVYRANFGILSAGKHVLETYQREWSGTNNILDGNHTLLELKN